MKSKEMIGKRFGLLTILDFASDRVAPSGQIRKYLLAKCDCGTIKDVPAPNVAYGKIKSCGCYKDENTRNRSLKHGCSVNYKVTPEYSTWMAIKARCTNKNNPKYIRYGGRGINICDEWADSFEKFLQDVGPRPSLRHTIDRKDNNIGYYPGNCKWSTSIEQSNNRRNNLLITYLGKTDTLSNWCRNLNLNYKNTWRRIRSGSNLDAVVEMR